MNAPFYISGFLAQLQGAAPSGVVPAPGGPQAAPQALPDFNLGAGDELRDILPPVDMPFWTTENRVLVALAAVLLTILFWSVFRRWQRRPRPPVAPPDPLKVALAALLRLDGAEGKALSDRDFAAAVAEVLRGFLEARHQLAAPRQTTEEFLEMAERSNRFPETVREQLHHFLRQCDELKFAKAGTTDSGRQGLRALAEEMLRGALS
jgi:hypothetical protein